MLLKGKNALKLRITIDGNTYEADVEVLDEEEGFETAGEPAYEEPVAAVQEPAGAGIGDNESRSPVTGLVIRVEVEPGLALEAGQLVIVLEAMKMETHVTAPRACRVKNVHVAAGDPVKIGQLLVEYE